MVKLVLLYGAKLGIYWFVGDVGMGPRVGFVVVF
jgi:hypothetical protein